MGTINPALFSSMEWRSIGPHRGGRVVAVAGDPVDPMAFYFGACAGGLWKSTDGGTYWRNVSDGFFKTSAVGAVAVSDSDPNVVYVPVWERPASAATSATVTGFTGQPTAGGVGPTWGWRTPDI